MPAASVAAVAAVEAGGRTVEAFVGESADNILDLPAQELSTQRTILHAVHES